MPGDRLLFEKLLPKRPLTLTIAMMVMEWNASQFVKISYCFAFCYCTGRIIA